MKSLESMDKATWTKKMLCIFYDLCIKVTNMRMRYNTHFDKKKKKELEISYNII